MLPQDSQGCFSVWLLTIFWGICVEIVLEGKARGKSYIEDEWLPKAVTVAAFEKPEWKFDTEVIGGALVFYNFALSDWQKHRFT